MSAMAKIWHKRILAGTQDYANCPIKYRVEVKEMLIEDVEVGIITAEQYEEITGEPYPEPEPPVNE